MNNYMKAAEHIRRCNKADDEYEKLVEAESRKLCQFIEDSIINGLTPLTGKTGTTKIVPLPFGVKE
jgi:hypothetical protein